MSSKEEIKVEEKPVDLKEKKTVSDIKEEMATYISKAITPDPKLHPNYGKLRY